MKKQAWVIFATLLLVLLAACGPGDNPGSTTGSNPNSTGNPGTEPVLSSTLKEGCGDPKTYATDKTGLAVGSKAINFTLKDTDGKEVRLSKLLAAKPVVMIFGSFS